MYFRKNDSWLSPWVISENYSNPQEENSYHPLNVVFIYSTSKHSHDPYIGITVIDKPELFNTMLMRTITYL